MKIVELGDVLKYEQPTRYIVRSEDYDDSYEIPVLTAGKSFLLGKTNEKDNVYDNHPVIIFDDFTTAFHYVDFPFKVKSSAMKLLKEDSDRADLKYLYHKMKTISFDAKQHKRYWISKYSKIKIPLPDLATQQAIVRKLDTAQKLCDLSQTLIEKYEKLSQSLFLEMFGDPVTNPKGWEVKKLEELGTLERGRSTHRPRNAPELLGGKYPLIQTGDVANSNGYIRKYNSTYSELGLLQSRIWKTGTLCITIAANIAKTGILMFDACFPDSIVGFTPNNEMTTNLYVQYWMSFLQKIIEESAPESAQKNINLAILRDLDIPVPPIELQNQFAENIAEIEKQKALAEQELAKSERLFAALLQESFS
ncbi:restriction endonuclease subunit S [Riemerella columbipharyngis]|uniref:Type I restriction enzyme, S subunit n=1 Tax=Riemerella columbipharyngis TaxID=1071918 RepID=A0A1G7DUL9_9FLAO|nr:restriction endonuclease subunit S [Riemerella columbipharyngis]SDE54890.1 type I restriction enzyme, S subunit [Riemerella columbipharyngis]